MGKNNQVGCGCDYCMSRGYRRDFRHGAVELEDFEDFDYRPRRKKKGCKKSKTGEPCDYSVAVIQRSYYGRDGWWHHYKTITCSRCGKHGWGLPGSGYFSTKEPI